MKLVYQTILVPTFVDHNSIAFQVMIIQDKNSSGKAGSWSVETNWQKIKLHHNSMECFKKVSKKEK